MRLFLYPMRNTNVNNSVIVILSLMLCLSQISLAQESGEKTAQQVWNRVLTSHPLIKDSNLPRDPEDLKVYFYWKEIAKSSNQIFLQTLEDLPENRIPDFARTYAGFFGSKDKEEKVRWILSCIQFAVSSRDIFYTNAKKIKPKYQKFACEFNKAMIENALKSQDYFISLYWLTLWSKPVPLIGGNEDSDDIGFALGEMDRYFANESKTGVYKEDDPLFWHHARLLLTIIYLCRGEHILRDFNGNFLSDYLVEKFPVFTEHYVMITTNKLVFNASHEENGSNWRYVVISEPMLSPFRCPNSPVSNWEGPFPVDNYNDFMIDAISLDPLTRRYLYSN